MAALHREETQIVNVWRNGSSWRATRVGRLRASPARGQARDRLQRMRRHQYLRLQSTVQPVAMPLLARGYERLLISHLRQRKREYYKTTLFVLLGLFAFILGFALVWRGPTPAPIVDATDANIRLFVDDPSIHDAVLEVAYVPQENSSLIYIRPAFKIADDRTVHWAILVGGVQIDVSPATAADKDLASRGYPLPEYRTVRQARPGPDRTLQMFLGVTT